MARFIGIIRGNRDEASRIGDSRSGVNAKINGWHIGIEVVASVDDDGNDNFEIYKTTGSNGNFRNKLITEIKDNQKS